VRMWTLRRACAWACAWACSLRRGGGRAHVAFAEGLRVGSVDAAHYSSAGASAQQSSYQPPPIRNYKGVMLCDRPVNKAAGSKVPQATASGQQMPFNCRFV
jgi:hypothetical protein